MQTLTINQKSVTLKEYKGQRVVTFKDVDCVHERPKGTARRNFNANKRHLINGVDYFVRNSCEAKTEFAAVAPNGLTLLTESGYLMLVKSFTDDLAWKVQRELVNNYFRAKAPEIPEQMKLEESTIKAKHYKGQLVITLRDLSDLTGIASGTFSYQLRTYKDYFIPEVDYWLLTGPALVSYKRENGLANTFSKCLTIITKCGLQKLSKSMNGVPAEVEALKAPASKMEDDRQEFNLPKERNEVQQLIDATLKELGAMECLIKRLDGYNTREDLKEITQAINLFLKTGFQKVAALTLLEV